MSNPPGNPPRRMDPTERRRHSRPASVDEASLAPEGQFHGLVPPNNQPAFYPGVGDGLHYYHGSPTQDDLESLSQPGELPSWTRARFSDIGGTIYPPAPHNYMYTYPLDPSWGLSGGTELISATPAYTSAPPHSPTASTSLGLRRSNTVGSADSTVSKCPLCGRRPSRARDLPRHILSCRQERPFICRECEGKRRIFRFKRKDHLQSHQRLIHDCPRVPGRGSDAGLPSSPQQEHGRPGPSSSSASALYAAPPRSAASDWGDFQHTPPVQLGTVGSGAIAYSPFSPRSTGFSAAERANPRRPISSIGEALDRDNERRRLEAASSSGSDGGSDEEMDDCELTGALEHRANSANMQFGHTSKGKGRLRYEESADELATGPAWTPYHEARDQPLDIPDGAAPPMPYGLYPSSELLFDGLSLFTPYLGKGKQKEDSPVPMFDDLESYTMPYLNPSTGVGPSSNPNATPSTGSDSDRDYAGTKDEAIGPMFDALAADSRHGNTYAYEARQSDGPRALQLRGYEKRSEPWLPLNSTTGRFVYRKPPKSS